MLLLLVLAAIAQAVPLDLLSTLGDDYDKIRKVFQPGEEPADFAAYLLKVSEGQKDVQKCKAGPPSDKCEEWREKVTSLWLAWEAVKDREGREGKFLESKVPLKYKEEKGNGQIVVKTDKKKLSTIAEKCFEFKLWCRQLRPTKTSEWCPAESTESCHIPARGICEGNPGTLECKPIKQAKANDQPDQADVQSQASLATSGRQLLTHKLKDVGDLYKKYKGKKALPADYKTFFDEVASDLPCPKEGEKDQPISEDCFDARNAVRAFYEAYKAIEGKAKPDDPFTALVTKRGQTKPSEKSIKDVAEDCFPRKGWCHQISATRCEEAGNPCRTFLEGTCEKGACIAPDVAKTDVAKTDDEVDAPTAEPAR